MCIQYQKNINDIFQLTEDIEKICELGKHDYD